MAQQTPVRQSPEKPNLPTVPEYHHLKDYSCSNPDVIYCMCKIRVDSDEGRAYEKLSTDEDRLQYMRLHAHEKMNHVSPRWTFYENNIERKRYLIPIASPEGKEAERLVSESDDEEESPKMEAVARYFKKYAHEVETITDQQMCPRLRDAK